MTDLTHSQPGTTCDHSDTAQRHSDSEWLIFNEHQSLFCYKVGLSGEDRKTKIIPVTADGAAAAAVAAFTAPANHMI